MAVHPTTNSARTSLLRIGARNSVPYCKGPSIGHKLVQGPVSNQQRPPSKQVRFSKQPSQDVVPAQCSSYTEAEGDGLQQAGATGILLAYCTSVSLETELCFGISPHTSYHWCNDLDPAQHQALRAWTNPSLPAQAWRSLYISQLHCPECLSGCSLAEG